MSNPVELSDLQRFEPFERLSMDQLHLIHSHSERRTLRSGDVLFCVGDRDDFDYFLLQGNLQFVSEDKNKRTVSQDDGVARRQLSKLRPRQYTVSALGTVEVLVVKAFSYDTQLAAAQEDTLEAGLAGYGVDEYVEPEQASDTELLETLQRALESDELKLPSLPQVALRIGELVESNVVSAEAVAKLVNTDPAIAAKLLRIANSSLYGSLGRCETTRDAIVRLGLGATRQLVLGFTLRDLFDTNNKALKAKLRASWVESLEVGALAMVIRSMLVDPDYSAEEALLAGLLHDIGVVGLLGMFLDQPELLSEDADLDQILNQLKSDVGAEILAKWKFAEGYIDVARHANNWQRESKNGADLCDLIQVAKLHRYLNNRVALPMTRLTDAPAVLRLPLQQAYSPETSLEILRQAKQQILEVKSLFD